MKYSCTDRLCGAEDCRTCHPEGEKMDNPDVIDMVCEYLERNGFDGLFNMNGDCACELPDICPCGEIGGQCTAGYRAPCDCGDHDFHIVEVRP